MKLLIAGSRTLHPSLADIDDGVERLFAAIHPTPLIASITHVVSGCAPGVDEVGEWWAHQRLCYPTCVRNQRHRPSLTPPCSTVDAHPADWKLGGMAGRVRNGKMARACDAALLFWDERSAGTRDMIEKLEALGRPKLVIPFGGGR